MSVPPRKVVVVTPVLDDWKSFATLVAELDEVGRGANLQFTVFAIDDGSSQPAPDLPPRPPGAAVPEVQSIRLVRNLGHQRAIAVGLVEAFRSAETAPFDAVVVMDSDGEDPPADIPALVRALADAPQGVAVASRQKRHDPLPIRMGYAIYKAMYGLLVNRVLDFGNFCAISPSALDQFAYAGHLEPSRRGGLQAAQQGDPGAARPRPALRRNSKMTVQSLRCTA